MNYRYLWLTALAFLIQVGSVLAQTQVMDMRTEGPGMAHTVYFWLTDDVSEDDKTSFETGMKSLASAPSVKRIFVGRPAGTTPRDVVDNSFDYSLVLWFDDVAGHDAYQESAVHLKFVEDHSAKFETVKVYDNELLE